MEPRSWPKLQFFLVFMFFSLCANSQDDIDAMFKLKGSLIRPTNLNWSDPDPCKWSQVSCVDNRVTRIHIGDQGLTGTLPSELSNLTQLQILEIQNNKISGALPSLNGLNSLTELYISNNQFTSVPVDFFTGMSSLQSVAMDNNPFSSWEIPESIKTAITLQSFSANSANVSGNIPDFFNSDVFSGLRSLHLAINNLSGSLPDMFSGSQIESLWVNGQKLTGGIDVLQNMTNLKDVWLHGNQFSGPLPDFSGLKNLEALSLRDNSFTGPVPISLTNLDSLKVVNLTNNLLQGPVPHFKANVVVDMVDGTNSFCLQSDGNCDPRVNTLLSIVKSLNYPSKFSSSWKGNDPCNGNWIGITCNNGNITIVNFNGMNLTGTISAEFVSLKFLQRLILAHNNLSGTIPVALNTLPGLIVLDVSYNNLYGKIPNFGNTTVITSGNPNIGKDFDPSSPNSSHSDNSNITLEKKKRSRNLVLVIVFSVIGFVLLLCLIGFCMYKRRPKKHFTRFQSPNGIVIHPRNSGSDKNNMKITIAGSSVTESSDIQAGNMVISIQVLRTVTNNFSQDNILGQGGFGTVYKGELHDGTKIAVKRMECGVMAGKGTGEFESEIAVLTKVRHRHLVSLLGYCLDGNEKLLVYEYMPQGTLSQHLFNWANEGFGPLEWTRRLTIALDVARGVEYLHGLAHQSFIHRDLKPSNILLGDDMRAKVSDFGLVRLAPDGKHSISTKIAGTFGYLAPEYAVTGRVTTKVDVYSFGVILMELITGRKALDQLQPEQSFHLVPWFRRALLREDTFCKSIDPTIDLDEDTLTSVRTVAELAGHCSSREPYQRPDMGHVVNVLSSIVEKWKPSAQNTDDDCVIDLDMSLPHALMKWHAFDSNGGDSCASSFIQSSDNTQTSIPGRTFTSSDGR